VLRYSELTEIEAMNAQVSEDRRIRAAQALASFEPHAVAKISAALTVILADLFALYIKTKNFHWHLSGPHFRDYHLLLDDQSEQIFSTTDAIAEYVAAEDMLGELLDDNRQLAVSLRGAHTLCDEHGDVASASLIETWIDEAEHRSWFLFEATR
jgi:starvation-inducible DNA-binding protein